MMNMGLFERALGLKTATHPQLVIKHINVTRANYAGGGEYRALSSALDHHLSILVLVELKAFPLSRLFLQYGEEKIIICWSNLIMSMKRRHCDK